MNDRSKLVLTVVIGGTMLGAGLSRYASPIMKAAPEAEWRDRYRADHLDASMQFVDAGPIDLSPALPWPGAVQQVAMFQNDPSSCYVEDYAADDLLPVLDEPADLAAVPPAIAMTVEEAAAAAARLERPPEPAAAPATAPAIANAANASDSI